MQQIRDASADLERTRPHNLFYPIFQICKVSARGVNALQHAYMCPNAHRRFAWLAQALFLGIIEQLFPPV
jgi:hypothetical protein